jgi:tRNA nucleotidyltransferase (CCA-adding enzyme)
VPEAILQIIAALDARGFETWLVGGCVRDLCLGCEPEDYDLATEARPEQVQALFPHHFATGLEHGTVTVLSRGLAVEITTFRSEGAYSDARRPDRVFFHNEIEADLSRRDFTMNSMAWRPDRGLLDLHGGLADLGRGVLRTVGEPEVRFREDALRLLRAIRFAVTFDLEPEPRLIQAAAQLSGHLSLLSRERLAAETLRILAAPFPKKLLAFGGCGLMAQAARLLLEQTTDDQMLCSRLARLIRPDLAPAERLPLLFLAAANSAAWPQDLAAALTPCFQTRARRIFFQILMGKSRLSRPLAQAGDAALYLLWLRLLLPPDRQPAAITQRRLIRLLARRCRFTDAGEVLAAHRMAGRLLALCLDGSPDAWEARLFTQPAVGREPLLQAELAIGGRDLLDMGCRAGPPLRRVLERLLSHCLVHPEENQPDRLRQLAKEFVSGLSASPDRRHSLRRE